MIHLDTSALVGALAGDRPEAHRLRDLTEQGEAVSISTLVLYEWLRGPRTREELRRQEVFFPMEGALPFGPVEALLAAEIYRKVGRVRQRAVDLAVAACAISHGAALWTLNPRDFRDVPGLVLV